MTLSLDTNVFVEVLRGRNAAVRERFAEALGANEPLRASLIVLHELYFGAELHPRPDKTRRQVGDLLSQVAVEPLDESDMRSAARLRAQLRQDGSTMGFYDVLIAGQALARGWTVVTTNVREFRRASGLDVVDWTAPATP